MALFSWSLSGSGVAARLRLDVALQAGRSSADSFTPPPGSAIDVRTFGAKGDGESDDTPAFLALRGWLRSHPGMHTVMVPAGTYRIGTANWLKGVDSVHLQAYGARFMNTTTGHHAYNVDNYALSFGGDIFSDSADRDFSPDAVSSGFLIQTAPAGSRSVQLQNPTDAGHLVVGHRVLIYGFNRQEYGPTYPPNPGYFEWNVIEAVDQHSGVVSLAEPLRNLYRADWKDSTNYGVTFGASRLLDLDRQNYHIATDIIIEGAEFIPTPGTTSTANGAIGAAGAMRITLRDVRATGFYPGETQSLTCVRCDFHPADGNGAVEVDKVIDSLIYRDSTIHNHTGATGANYLEFNGCTLTGGMEAHARQIVLQDCNVRTQTGKFSISVSSPYYLRELHLNGNRFQSFPGMVGAVNEGQFRPFAVAGVPSPGRIIVPIAGNEYLSSSLELGAHVSFAGPGSPKAGIILGFSQQNGSYLIDGQFSDPPQPGETWQIWTTDRVLLSGNSITTTMAEAVPGARALLAQSSSPKPILANNNRATQVEDWDSRASTKVERYLRLDQNGYKGTWVNGTLYRFVINVQKPYTGPDGSCTVEVADASRHRYGTINCVIAGVRELSVERTAGAKGGDVLNSLPGQYVESIQIFLSNGRTNALNGETSAMPIVTVILEGMAQQ